ncbi:MAG: glycosyl transferase [Alphaproteobacteria bacterium]
MLHQFGAYAVPDTDKTATKTATADVPIVALPVDQLFAAAEAFDATGDRSRTAALYGTWLLGNQRHELLHVVLFNYAVALGATGETALAAAALRRCLELAPDFSPAHINLGRILEDGGSVDAAVHQWMACVDHLKGVNGSAVKYKILALHQLARVLEAHDKDGAAEDALRQALELGTDQPEAIQHFIALRQRQCKWPIIGDCGEVDNRSLAVGISPLSLANLSDDPMFQLARAYSYNKRSIAPGRRCSTTARAASLRGNGRLRVGYVSSDLRDHAVGFAMTDVFETHDKSRFEVFAYYCGIARTDATQQRIKVAADAWLDINGMSDEAVAERIVGDGIDILVDLNGYTKDARTRVFAFRPAPIAVNWFGFPGTMGSPYHHYIIADDIIIPQDHERYFSEKVVRLPCYQPNDRKRTVAAGPSRQQECLPPDAVVYCCLNGTQKFTPDVFRAWMTVLTRVESSVLWLLGAAEETNARLRSVAASQGVAPERLIFAQKKPNPEHLARFALADLFLDTFPYGAHTTASDALWMGVPVLTIPGQSFASRVCASVLHAAGLPEMAVPNIESYIDTAVRLGHAPDELAAVKSKLAAGRDSCVLFDTPRLVRELEGLYQRMWSEFVTGVIPRPDLTNLGIYNDIGVDLEVRGAARAPGDDIDLLYADALASLDWQRPIMLDRRLWQGAGR